MENNDYSIVLVEDYPCETKYQLERQERYHIENNVCVNKHIPTQTSEEYGLKYRATHQEKIKADMKQYRETHKESIKEQRNLFRQVNKEKILEYQRAYRARKKDNLNLS